MPVLTHEESSTEMLVGLSKDVASVGDTWNLQVDPEIEYVDSRMWWEKYVTKVPQIIADRNIKNAGILGMDL